MQATNLVRKPNIILYFETTMNNQLHFAEKLKIKLK